MSGNFVQQAVTSGGTSTVTLGAATAANRQVLTNVKSVGQEFRGSFADGDDREIGIYKLDSTGPTIISRVSVEETLVSGALNRLNPTALDLSTSATFQITPYDKTSVQTSISLPFQASAGIVGRTSDGLIGATQTNDTLGTLRRAYPYKRESPGYVTSASVVVGNAVASATIRLFAYRITRQGAPGLPIGEFTTAGSPIDCSTSGIKTATPASPIYIEDREILIVTQASLTGVSLSAPTNKPEFGLGTNASGVTNCSFHITADIANIGRDETGFVWSANNSYLTIWLNG